MLCSTLAALVLLFHLARTLYTPRIALATLVVVLLLPTHPNLHVLTIGRQVLGEMPMLFFLLAGYTCLAVVLQHSWWWLLPAAGYGGLALITKAQVVPFWALSLLLPVVGLLVVRRWHAAATLGLVLAGSFLTAHLWRMLIAEILRGHTVAGSALQGLYGVTALVPQASVRGETLQRVLWLGLPTMLGLGYAAWVWLRTPAERQQETPHATMRLVLLSLAGSWFAWYLLLSVGWLRYLFPPFFLGSIFIAALLDAATCHSSPLRTLERLQTLFIRKRFAWHSLGTLLVLLLVVAMLPFNRATLQQLPISGRGPTALMRLADHLNHHIPAGSLIETYDTEVFFVLNQPYHFPPDQVHVALNRRTFLEQDVTITYDPLAADPDYLVVGPNGRMWQLYEPVLERGAFELVQQYGWYDLYQRRR
jgi:hypothetical protein